MKIEILTKSEYKNSVENHSAEELKSMILNSIPENVDGKIYIVSNFTINGEEPVRDYDLVVWGSSSKCILKHFYSQDGKDPKKDLLIKDFMIVIELKEHPIDCLSVNNSHLFAQYAEGAKDITEQSEDQRFSMKDFLLKNDMRIYVSNAIWLKTVSKDDLSVLTAGYKWGALPNNFAFKDLVKMIINHGCKPIFDRLNDRYILSAGVDIEILNAFFREPIR